MKPLNGVRFKDPKPGCSSWGVGVGLNFIIGIGPAYARLDVGLKNSGIFPTRCQAYVETIKRGHKESNMQLFFITQGSIDNVYAQHRLSIT